jgi:hypothetical protein
MNRDDIIRMAREAGFVVNEKAQQHQPNCIFHTYHMVDELLERFAFFVAAAAKAEEREACAQVCDDTDVVRFWHGGMEHDDGNRTLGNAAAAIRARGEV